MKSRDNRKCTCRKPRRDQPLFFFYPFFGVRCRWFAPCLLRVRCLPACGPSCSCLSTSRVYACLFFQYRSFVYNCRRQTLQFFLLFFFYSSVCYKHTLFIFVFSSTLVLQSSTLRRDWLWGFQLHLENPSLNTGACQACFFFHQHTHICMHFF